MAFRIPATVSDLRCRSSLRLSRHKSRRCVRLARLHIVNTAATEPATSSTSVAAAQSACPFHAVTSSLGIPTSSSSRERTVNTASIPGPAPFSLDSLQDVSKIFFDGLHVAMLKFSEKYGPICRFANPAALNGANSWVFLNSPENVQHICATNVKNYTMRYLPDIYKFVTHEKGILGSQGDYNMRHRKLCQPAFRNKSQLQSFSRVVVRRSNQLADIWSKHGSFATDIATQTQRLTLDIVGLTAFSHDFQQVERVRRDMAGQMDGSEATDRVLWAVNTFGEVLAEVFITPLPVLRALQRLGFPQLRNLQEAVDVMRGSMLDVIQARRQAIAAGEAGKDDLLGVLLQSVDDDGRPMTDEELWEDVHDIMGAGHETTATTTAALLYCISAHPEVERRVAQELREVLGDRDPEYSDMERLQYLTQCVKETLRLYPAIPIFPREAAADDVLPSGHAVDAGDVVFMSSYALGRCPKLWPDPLEFNPDRFSEEGEARMHRFQFLPFGAGPRMCLGASFAQMSVTLMAATLLRRFRFTALTPSSRLIPVTYDITMNFNTTKGLHMKVDART